MRNKSYIILFLSLAMSICFWGSVTAAPISIVNNSFEYPVMSKGGWNYSVADWAPGPSTTAGVWYPGNGYFNVSVPDGNQVLYLNSGSVSQVLTAVLMANTTYTLSVDVGHRNDDDFNTGKVSLYAGSQELASGMTGPSYFDPGRGLFGTLTISYTSTSSSPGLGDNLKIVFAGNNQSDFDNVRLTTSNNVPVPAAVWLLGSGLLGLLGIRRKFRK